MLTSSCDAGSGGDDGKVPTTEVVVVGTFLLRNKRGPGLYWYYFL